MKRTTLVLDDACMSAVRRLARRSGRTITDVVNELLAQRVQRRDEGRATRTFELPAYDRGVPRVDITDRDALERLTDTR